MYYMCETLHLTVFPATNSLTDKQCNKIQTLLQNRFPSVSRKTNPHIDSYVANAICVIIDLLNGINIHEQFLMCYSQINIKLGEPTL